MPETSEGSSAGKSEQVAALAQRLRRIQARCAQQPDADLSALVAEEVRRALAATEPGGHEALMEEVRAQFPEWESDAQAQTAEAMEGGVAPLDPQSEAGALVEQLIQLLPELSDDERYAAADQLAAAGLAPPTDVVWRADVLAALMSGLGLRNGEIPDPNRVAELAMLMSDFGVGLQQLTWATWRTIAPHAKVGRGVPVQKNLSRFVAGQPDVSREQIAAELNALRHLIASMISAISDVGHQFAASHLSKFLPAEIESAVDAEGGGGMFKNKAALCWKKYAELSDTLEPAAIETEIRRVIAEHAEHLLKGLGS